MRKIFSTPFQTFGSFERFNRVLYGGHDRDTVSEERFFTFAGDTPIFLGASSDYQKNTWCYQAKNGYLLSGLAMTPGYVEQGVHDNFSGWFHDSSDCVSRWHHGYMSYDLTRFSPYMAGVRVSVSVYPLNPHNGFLVRYRITTDQRVLFCAGLGGITPYFSRFEYHESAYRDFRVEDCQDNQSSLQDGYGVITGPEKVTLLMGTDFACEWQTDSAQALAETSPSLFLPHHGGASQVLKIKRELQAGETFTGSLVVLQNGTPELLKELLADPQLEQTLKNHIREKYACVSQHTPDQLLDASLPGTIIANDASFHGRSFYHGAVGYHAPFLGWRAWYGPILLHWSERVKTAIINHFNTITRFDEPEKIWWDGADRPDLDHEGTQYHHLVNSSGKLTALLDFDDIYDMQEVAIDMTLYYLEHTGDADTCQEIFDRLCELLDWEERVLDPNHTGLYQNFLNTWISDGHCYNGALCAQASSYNYAANARTAALGRRLGKDVTKQEQRAARIQQAFREHIWQPSLGIPAESIDTLGNRLVHASPELSTIYLAADCGNTTATETWRMMQWTKRNIPHTTTVARQGHLYFNSNWLPRKYSTYGIFPAENACLALMCYQAGQGEEGWKILNGLIDAFQLSPYPGSITHVLSAHGGTDDGDLDFTDVSSCYLRLVFEGLWGIRFKLSENKMFFAPQLPANWDHASLSLPEVSIVYNHNDLEDNFLFMISQEAEKIFTIPMRTAAVDQVLLNGQTLVPEILPGIGKAFLRFRTQLTGRLDLKILYQDCTYPQLKNNHLETYAGNRLALEADQGTILKILDFCHVLQAPMACQGRQLSTVTGNPGCYDLLIALQLPQGQFFQPLELTILPEPCTQAPLAYTQATPQEMNEAFNASLTEIHQQEFRSPRPENYSIGMRLNGRYAWEWNHYGHNALKVDDSRLRDAGGTFVTPSGIPFLTPATGHNAATVSLWDNFPTTMTIPLSGTGKGLALLLCGTTNAMQSYVVNATITVNYEDGTKQSVNLVNQENFDDFLVAAYQQQNETVYFSDGTHGMVQKIKLDEAKPVQSITLEAVALEVILNLLAITWLN